MALYYGLFHGYRELELKIRRGPRTPVAISPIRPPTCLHWFQWDNLGYIPYQYAVFKGEAEDEFPDDFTFFPFQTRMISCIVRDNPASFIGTHDGVTPLEERDFEFSFVRLESFKGFKVKNAVPGLVSRYQVIGYR